MLPLLLLLACPRATVVDACLEDPELCPACEGDEDCGFSGNPCTDTVYCAHDAAELAVVQIGCSEALERRWPPDEDCACVDAICQSGAD